MGRARWSVREGPTPLVRCRDVNRLLPTKAMIYSFEDGQW